MKSLMYIPVLLLGALISPLGINEAAAERPIVRMQVPETARPSGSRRSILEPESQFQPQAVMLSGPLRHRRGEGLSVGDIVLRLSANTGVFPEPVSGRSPSLSSLQGKHATVLGIWSGPRVLDAQLILIQETGQRAISVSEVKPWMIPSNSDSDVGEMTNEVPQ